MNPYTIRILAENRRPTVMRVLFRVALIAFLLCRMAVAQVLNVPPPAASDMVVVPARLKFNNTPLEMVLDDYSEKTGRTMLLAPGLPKITITLKSQGDLTMDEYLEAIESVLAMNNLSLIKVGNKFLKAVQTINARQEEMIIREDLPEGGLPETSELVTQLISLKHIEAKEADALIKPVRRTSGTVHLLERTNSILVTDSAAVINRVLQVIQLVDQPMEAAEEPNVIEIRYAKAADIKRRLEEIIAESQKEGAKSTVPQQRPSGQPGVVAPLTTPSSTIPGVIRAPRVAAGVTPPAEVLSLLEQAERGIIVGKVKIVADDRTNLLIIITRPENMKFFDRIIRVLDVETEPDVVVRIFRLEYADAEQVASTLNSLIGSNKDATGAVKGAAGTAPETSTGTTPAGADAGNSDSARSAVLRDYVERLNRGAASSAEAGISKVGELSASNIKILSDKRTNALLIMASKSDAAALEGIVKGMDMMLSQVMIETVVIQVDLDETVRSGVQWVQRSLLVQDRDASGALRNRGAIAGSAGGGRGSENFIPEVRNTPTLTTIGSWASGAGLTTYFTHFGLNLDMIVKLLKTDSRSRIMSAPVIVTTDNTKATITSSAQRYFLKGSTVDQFGNVRPETEIKDIGLQLTVTPHINNSRNVMMEIAQEISDEGVPQPIEGQGSWPTTTKRTFTASIAVRDRETIILGGLTRKYMGRDEQKVPILGSIPLLGRLFSYRSDVERNGEVVVFITPYVLDTPEQIEKESMRMKEALSTKDLWERGWSDSDLAEPIRRRVRDTETEVNAPLAPPVVLPDLGAGTVQPSETDAMDPELAEFIRQQESRWGDPARRLDEAIRRDVEREQDSPSSGILSE